MWARSSLPPPRCSVNCHPEETKQGHFMCMFKNTFHLCVLVSVMVDKPHFYRLRQRMTQSNISDGCEITGFHLSEREWRPTSQHGQIWSLWFTVTEQHCRVTEADKQDSTQPPLSGFLHLLAMKRFTTLMWRYHSQSWFHLLRFKTNYKLFFKIYFADEKDKILQFYTLSLFIPDVRG